MAWLAPQTTANNENTDLADFAKARQPLRVLQEAEPRPATPIRLVGGS